MRQRSFLTSLVAAGIFLFLSFVSNAHAQIPGAILSAGAMGGIQSSSRSDMQGGDYYAVRGAFSNLFGEYRHIDWGNAANGIHENGYLAGADLTLFHIMFSAAAGIGTCQQQMELTNGTISKPASYNSLIYEGQAMYQFDIVAGMITAGIGVNYTAESNSVAPISGWGGVASLNIGL